MSIAAYVPNLMDRSRVAAVADALGVDIRFASSPAGLDPAASLTVVDLGRPGVIEALEAQAAGSGGGSPGRRVVGFASHVDRELLARGRAGGCHQVLARSAFFSRLPAILSSADRADPTGPADPGC
jgi:hypothetical protein